MIRRRTFVGRNGERATSENLLFFDGFESGDMATTNADGFAWASNNATSIVTMKDDHPDHVGEMWSVAIWNNGAINNASPTLKDWYAKTGSNSLRARYAAGLNANTDQVFDLGANYTDIWFRFWFRVPTAFNYPAAGTNNKLFSFWSTTYDQSYTLTLQLRPASPSGSAKLVYQDGGVAVGEVDVLNPFITYSTDWERWMQLAIRVKSASGLGADDGVIEIHRKWSDESSFTRILNDTSASTWATSGSQGIRHGRWMGYNNAAYAAETEFLMDDFTVSTGSLAG